MPAHVAPSRSLDAPPADAVIGYADRPGLYLTDEVFLYRVVCRESGAEDLVELEDCYLLDVARLAQSDLYSRRLRVVTPASEL